MLGTLTIFRIWFVVRLWIVDRFKIIGKGLHSLDCRVIICYHMLYVAILPFPCSRALRRENAKSMNRAELTYLAKKILKIFLKI